MALNNEPCTAEQLWEQGQAAMRRRRPDEAIVYYERSLAADPGLRCNLRSVAAAYLEMADPAEACVHLAKYVEAYPEDLDLRACHADLLLRMRRFSQARCELERLTAEAQEQSGFDADYLLQAQSRLMQIAQFQQDDYGEHLHRGIGVYLLARRRAALMTMENELPAEALFCKAAAELTTARLLRPQEARPSWYLHEVWSQLGQSQPALLRLGEAAEAAPFTYLTPAEQRRLYMTCQSHVGQSERGNSSH
jgi:tetratricopeptide (TPR) repeat protein